MNDYREMRAYLDGLTPREFIEQMAKFGVNVTNVSEEGLRDPGNNLGAGHFEPFDRWRERRTLTILKLRVDNPTLWKEYCEKVGITTDDARTLDYQRVSADASADAARSARASAAAAAASERHASTANRIAEKSNRMSLASIIVSGITALIAVGSLIVAIIALSK